MENNIENVITIDGPGGSGKSTVSRILAKTLNRLYLDTGALYRAVALAADRAGINPSEAKKLEKLCEQLDIGINHSEDPPKIFLGKEDITAAIRTPKMDMLSSAISAVQQVREAMYFIQRKMAEEVPVVAEGRDMGTVVFPEAKHKFFLTASPRIRAQRRYEERLQRGESVSLSEVKKELIQRDRQDQTRAIAPLIPAKDAIIIDSSSLTVEQVAYQILEQMGGEID